MQLAGFVKQAGSGRHTSRLVPGVWSASQLCMSKVMCGYQPVRTKAAPSAGFNLSTSCINIEPRKVGAVFDLTNRIKRFATLALLPR